MSDLETLQSMEKALNAMLLMMLEEREKKIVSSGANSEKTESLMNRSGYSSTEISKILNKNKAAVIKTIQRSRK